MKSGIESIASGCIDLVDSFDFPSEFARSNILVPFSHCPDFGQDKWDNSIFLEYYYPELATYAGKHRR